MEITTLVFYKDWLLNFKNENIPNVCSLSQDFGLLQGLTKIFKGCAEIRPCVKKKKQRKNENYHFDQYLVSSFSLKSFG